MSQNKINKEFSFYFTALLILLLCPWIVPRGYEIICGAALFWMLRGPLQVIQTLSLIVIIKNLNPAFIELSLSLALMGWGAVFIAVLRAIFLLKKSMMQSLFSIIIFSMVVAVFSFFVSPNIDVSMMKILSFALFSCAVVVCALSLNAKEAESLKVWIFSFYAVIVLLSLPIYFFPAIGFNRNAAGFQGIMNHPQLFGIILSPLTAWMLCRVLITREKSAHIWWIVIVLLISLHLFSQARTGILAVALALMVAFFFGLAKKKSTIYMSKAVMMGMLVFVFGIIAYISSGDVSDKVDEFLLKGDGSNVSSAFTHSRGGAISSQWNNFIANPLMGTGFGVYPNGMHPNSVSYFHGIPISASVEKGFLPTAILEEVGLIGFLLFLNIIYSLGKFVFNDYEVKWVAMFAACLFVNLGESIFFGINGISQWFWVLIALCIAQGNNSKWNRRSQT